MKDLKQELFIYFNEKSFSEVIFNYLTGIQKLTKKGLSESLEKYDTFEKYTQINPAGIKELIVVKKRNPELINMLIFFNIQKIKNFLREFEQ